MAKVRSSLAEIQAIPNYLSALAAEAAELARLIQESNGELTPEVEARLEVNSTALLAKVDNYNFIIEHLEAQAALWKRRKDACAAQEKKFMNQVNRLWDRIKAAMKEMGRDELEGKLYRLKLSRSKAKLVIQDEAAIPDELKMVVQETLPDKDRIRMALEQGIEVPGCSLVEEGTLRVSENAQE